MNFKITPHAGQEPISALYRNTVLLANGTTGTTETHLTPSDLVSSTVRVLFYDENGLPKSVLGEVIEVLA